MSSKEQTCATELKSTVFHNLWQIHKFNGAEKKRWISDVFYGYSAHNSGSEVSWHYNLEVTSSDQVYDHERGDWVTDHDTRLSVLVDNCNTSMDATVELDQETTKISGKTTVGSTLGSISISGDKIRNRCLKDKTLTFRLKFTLTEDPVPQDSQLTENYMSLLTNEQLSDVTIQVGPEKFYAQKAILSVRSPVFAAMFQSGMQEAKLNHLVVEDIEPKVFKELLRFIYVGKVERLKEMIHGLLAAADKYALDKLRTICDNHLLGFIEKETVLKTLALADLYHAEELKKQTILFVCKNIKSMKETDWKSYNQTHPDLVAEILSAMTIN